MSKATNLKPADYVHLHNHTHHSLLDGLQKIPKMLSRVEELGMDAIAITDHGTLSGALEFYKASQDTTVKPIIGMETYVASRLHTDKDPSKDKARYHLILLAMNNEGYRNLMKLSSVAQLDGFYHKPRIDHELLEQYNRGIIVLSGCVGGEVGERLRYDQDEEAKDVAKWYKSVFGDRYYLEIQDHGHQWDTQKKVNEKVLKLAEELAIKPVLTADAHYLKHDDQDAHEILLCVQTGSFLSDEKRMSLKGMDLYLSDPAEMLERWRDTPEVITNTAEIASRCKINIELGKILIPKFSVPKGKTENSYLQEKVYQGLAWRYSGLKSDESKKLTVKQAQKKLSKGVLERAAYELKVIESMGFDGYFLIVQDFIIWGKDQGIVFGPGRGSAAGSIVSYALSITDLDPLAYDLLFERFLNPDRISMPDIDIDIQDSRRDEVIQYCVEKYGQDRVAHIVTFGTMAARNAIRDVARVLEVPYADADHLAKLVPPPFQGRHIPLEKSIKKDKDLKEEYENNQQSKEVIDLAIKLEGTIRSHGVHAAGVVIAPDEITKYVPLEMAQKGVVATQYAMNEIEDLGLLKMDFLGLSNLTIIKNALRIIKKVDNTDIDIGTIPLDDPKTFELFARGDTTGVFQLESAGMKRYIKQLKPTRFEDIVAMVALYRPGPMQFIDDFIARKHGQKKIEYLHDKMENALETTYGVLVYQEQVMQIAKDMCGFSGGQADTLRKAIGKKKADLMAKMKKEFIEGGIEHSGADKQLMEKFWQQLEEFAAYCFNKSHAASYGLIAYWTAYLKANYPDAFMAALMTSDYDDTDRLAIEITECKHMGIDVLAPDVNESFAEFAVVPRKQQIRFGMTAIKNVGSSAVEEIVRVRDESGKFESIDDFVTRVSTRIVNRKTWESLIKAGAFDNLGDRATLLFNLDTILGYGSKLQKQAESGQTDLFGDVEDVSVAVSIQLDRPAEVITDREQLLWERELLGIYLSSHPLDDFEEFLEEQAVQIGDLQVGMDGKSTRVGGLITRLREITTKNGSSMAFVGIEDKSGETELIVFPNVYSEKKDMWQQDNVVVVKGEISTKDREGRSTDEIKILVNEAHHITHETAKAYKKTGKKPSKPRSKTIPGISQAKKFYVHLKDPEDSESLIELKKTLQDHPGDMDAILILGDKDKSAIKLPFKVNATDKLKQTISDLLGPTAVKVV